MMLRLHTTGLKSRAIGHENEVSAWTLMTPDDKWVSYRSNNKVRLGAPDFYPEGISYQDSQTSNNQKVYEER